MSSSCSTFGTPFGKPSSNTFGSSAFGQINNASSNTSPFGSPIGLPASGSSTNFGFAISSSPSFSFSSTPAFGQSISPFGTPLALGVQDTTPTFGRREFYFGQPAFGGERIKPAYSSTAEIDGEYGTQPAGKFESISAMPFYEEKSHEVLRWEDYQVGNKGTSVAGPTPSATGFGPPTLPSTPISATSRGPSSTRSFSYRSTPAFESSSTSGFGATSIPFSGLRSTPFSATDSGASGLFKSPTPAFEPSSSTGFGRSSTPPNAFPISPSCISSSSGTTPFSSLQSTPFSATDSGASGLFKCTTPAFGPSSTGFGRSSTPPSAFPISPSCIGSSFSTTPSPLKCKSYTFGDGATAPIDINGRSGAQPTAGKLGSISAMPVYKDKSHEELRWEDYQQGDYGGWTWKPADQCTCGNLFRALRNPFISSSTPGCVSTPSFSFGRTPACSGSTSAFDQSPFCRTLSPFVQQHGGSRVAAYTPTTEIDCGNGGPHPPPKSAYVMSFPPPSEQQLNPSGKPEKVEASTSKWSKKKIEDLRMEIEVEREVEKRMSQRHRDFLTSILKKIDNLNI